MSTFIFMLIWWLGGRDVSSDVVKECCAGIEDRRCVCCLSCVVPHRACAPTQATSEFLISSHVLLCTGATACADRLRRGRQCTLDLVTEKRSSPALWAGILFLFGQQVRRSENAAATTTDSSCGSGPLLTVRNSNYGVRSALAGRARRPLRAGLGKEGGQGPGRPTLRSLHVDGPRP